MEIPSKEYLQKLIIEAHQKFNDFEPIELDPSCLDISYIPTKNHPRIGIKDGVSGLAKMRKHKIKESASIRSNCLYYHKLYKSSGKVVKISSSIDGREGSDGGYFAYYEGNYRYLFPYSKFGTKSWTYMFVTHYENGRVSEEFMVSGKQIIYEKYSYSNEDRADYYYINYVPTSSDPVVCEKLGYYLLDTLECIIDQYYVWYQNT